MLDLFQRSSLFEVAHSGRIRLAIFSGVQRDGSGSGPVQMPAQWTRVHFEVQSNLVLYCDDYHLELCQFEPDDTLHRFSIPVDREKGHIAAMCLDSRGSNLLAITSQSTICLIPLQFALFRETETGLERSVILKDATLVDCLEQATEPPTSIVWWQRDESYCVEHTSVAIVAYTSGLIRFVDLSLKKQYLCHSVSAPIESMQVFDEMYTTSLLVTCANQQQYQLVLEQFRSNIETPYSSQSGVNEQESNLSPGPSLSFNNYLLTCVFDLPFEKNGEVIASVDASESHGAIPHRPRLITYNEDIDSALPQNNNSPDCFAFIDSPKCPKMLMYPQCSASILLVKQQKAKVELNEQVASNEESVSAEHFCDVSINRDLVLELFEVASHEFCTKSIFLSYAKLYIVPLNQISLQSKFVRIIDCGYRFMLLVYTDRCILVSKNFAQQASSTSCTSPRFRLNKKKDLGSFRRKNLSSRSQTISVMEEFHFESDSRIVDAFITCGPGAKYTGIKEFVKEECSAQSVPAQTDYLDMQVKRETQLIELLSSPCLESFIRIDEQFLVVTECRVYRISSRERSFSQYFQSEMEYTLEMIDSGQNQDGDLITHAKLLVECFGTLALTGAKATVKKSLSGGSITSLLTGQDWQIWLYRVALLLLQRHSEANEEVSDFRRTFRLFEVSRTSRRRVITSLVHFHFWHKALSLIRTYFKTKVLHDLSTDERNYLAEQMFQSLIALHLPHQDQSHTVHELYRFLHDYRFYYHSKRMMNRLLDYKLVDMARYVALLTGEYSALMQLLLQRLDQLLNKSTRRKMLNLLTSKRVAYSLIQSVEYLPTDGVRSIRLIESYLGFVFTQLTSLSSHFLFRLASIFDPDSLCMQFLFHQTLSYCNQTYLSSSSGQTELKLLPIRKNELINLYILVLLVCLRTLKERSHDPISLYDYQFITTVQECCSQFDQCDHSVTPNTVTLPVELRLASGTFFSVVYSPAEFTIWGDFEHFPSVNLEDPSDQAAEPSGRLLIRSNILNSIRVPTTNRFFSTVIDAPIESIATGHQHILFLTRYGLFAMGVSKFGQLGLGPKVLETKYPTLVDKFDVRVRKVVCGVYHSLAISAEGHLYSWGWALHGQLGHGLIEDEFRPRRVQFFDSIQVADVAAGYSHTAVLSTTGDLYVFGEDSYGQLGLGSQAVFSPDKAKFSVPHKHPAFNSNVQLVGCGLFHTVVLAREDSHPARDRLYCWGLDPKTWRWKMRTDRASTAQLCQALAKQSIEADMPNLNVTLQEVFNYSKIKGIEMPPNVRIVKISAGQSHTLLLSADEAVYSTGYGRDGQLGLGEEVNAALQQIERVEDLGRIRDIACGADHSLAIDSEGNIFAWGHNFSAIQSDRYPKNQVQLGFYGQPQFGEEERILPEEASYVAFPYKINNSWIPAKIFSIQVSSQITSKCLDFCPQPGHAYHDPDTLKRLVMKTLVKYKPILDFESLLKRFEKTRFFQFGAIVAFSLRNYRDSFRYQMSALVNEIELLAGQVDPCSKQKWMEEIGNLAIFFTNQCSRDPEKIGQLLRILIDSWLQIEAILTKDSYFNFRTFLNLVYLDSGSTFLIENSFFGYSLMQLLCDEDSHTLPPRLRLQLELSDQTLLQVVARVERLINTSPRRESEIVLFQQLLEQLLKTKVFEDFVGDVDVLFPHERRWRNLLDQLGRSPNRDTPLDGPTSLPIDIHIPADIDCHDEESSIMLVFQCGHCCSVASFRTHYSCSPASAAHEALLARLDNPASSEPLQQVIGKLPCVHCSSK